MRFMFDSRLFVFIIIETNLEDKARGKPFKHATGSKVSIYPAGEAVLFCLFVLGVGGNLRLPNVCCKHMLFQSLIISLLDLEGIFSPCKQTEGGTLTSLVVTQPGHFSFQRLQCSITVQHKYLHSFINLGREA